MDHQSNKEIYTYIGGNCMNFKDYIRVIPDFPQPGISFKDITTLLKDGKAYQAAIDEMKELVKTYQIDCIAGPEARGFVIGAPLAYSLGVGFIPIRKSGKLPGETIEADYALEYGNDKLAMHKDGILPGQRVLIADDLLATGGTIQTSINLVNKLGGEVVAAAFLIELSDLNGREKLAGIDVLSLITY
jgi:adenine phosphoribosyltransferase